MLTENHALVAPGQGFTGLSRDNDDRGASTASRHAGTPGFRYQREIHECSHCAKPINGR